jgi:cytochrome c-type biogenesis protein CcmH/NrfG
MGFVLFLFLALCLFAALWFIARLDRGALLFIGAGLFIALAGYAWQGRPGLAGAPKHAAAVQRMPDSLFSQIRPEMLGRFDSASRWLGMSDMYQRGGDTFSAVEIIRSGLRQGPRDADLWIGLGVALVQHGNGMMTPAARIAFARAEALAPGHPAVRFFYGLALAQGGQLEEAERLWRELLVTAPPDASWRPMVEARLQMLQQVIRAGQGPAQGPVRQAPGPEPQPAP